MMSGAVADRDDGGGPLSEGRTTMADPTFGELVSRARGGDPEATRALVDRYQGAIRREVRFAILDGRLRRLLDETDVLQSVLGRFFLDLGAGRYDFEGPEQMAGLLREMVRAKVADHARYWKAARRDYRRNVEPGPDPAFAPASADPSPSRQVSDADFLAEFERRLTPQERAILALRRQGAGWPEVAATLEGGAEALRKRFERALDRVGRELDVRGEQP